jgi:hypothetical protein
MSSITCQKDYTMLVNSGGGPPHGPIQLDAATVAQMNAYAKFLTSGMIFTGTLNWTGGNWFEEQSDSPGYGLAISPNQSPSMALIVTPPHFAFDAAAFYSDSLAGTFPVGVWTIQFFTPSGGFSPQAPGWPAPLTVTATWA